MKTIWLLLLLIGFCSCDAPLKKKELPIIVQDSIINDTSVVILPKKDSLPLVEAAPKDTIPKIVRPIFSIEKLQITSKNILQKAKKVDNLDKKYKEDIPFKSFLGEAIEWGELELINFDSIHCIYADYFKDTPIGAKRFLSKNKQLFSVEVIQLEEKVTEAGIITTENISHQFYYQNQQLITAINNQNQEIIDTSSISWHKENMVDWQTIQVYL